MGIRELTTSASHTKGNGGTESVNRMMAHMLSMVVDESQDDWGASNCPAYNNSVRVFTCLDPNEVRLGHLPTSLASDRYRASWCMWPPKSSA